VHSGQLTHEPCPFVLFTKTSSVDSHHVVHFHRRDDGHIIFALPPVEQSHVQNQSTNTTAVNLQRQARQNQAATQGSGPTRHHARRSSGRRGFLNRVLGRR
jgi:hypothetical protein